MKKLELEAGREQFSILTSQLETLVNNSVWDKVNKDGILRTANQLKNIVNCPKRRVGKDEIGRFIGILNKAKVKAVMSNDSNYYDVCSRLDSIISNVSKFNGGE